MPWLNGKKDSNFISFFCLVSLCSASSSPLIIQVICSLVKNWMEKSDFWDTTAAWELPRLLGISRTAQQDTREGGESGMIWDVNHEVVAPTSLSKHTSEAGGRSGRETPPSFPSCPVRALIYPFIYFSLAEALPLIMVWMGPAPFKAFNPPGGLQSLDKRRCRGFPGAIPALPDLRCTRGLAGALGTRLNPSINVTSRQS